MNIAVARNVGLALLLGLAMLASSAGSAAASDPMLAGMTEAKMAFDITAAEPPRLLSILNVIEETRDGLVRQGITPRIILAFRGPATVLLRADQSGVKPEDRETVAKVAAKIRELRGATGIERVEVCSIAMRLTKTPKEQLVPDVTVVENGWYTLVGAQAKGYAYIAP
jgi:intracellular sulfur oxidation DsrE/DsrF family protein